MKKCLIILFCLVFLSCASHKKEVISRSTIKLEGKNTNIRDLLNIDGVYSSSTMFFDDGSWVNFSMKESKNERITNLSKLVESWTSGKQIRWGTYWGVYTIKNDTIIVHSYDKPSTLSILKSISIDEIRYKIINNNTIQMIYYRINSKAGDKYYKATIESPWLEQAPILHFTPADSLLSSDNWLKENKWIWHNESDWREYMRKMK